MNTIIHKYHVLSHIMFRSFHVCICETVLMSCGTPLLGRSKTHLPHDYPDFATKQHETMSMILLMLQKSGGHQLRFVVYPIIYKVLYYTSQVVDLRISEPSTVSNFAPDDTWVLCQKTKHDSRVCVLPAAAEWIDELPGKNDQQTVSHERTNMYIENDGLEDEFPLRIRNLAS